MLAASAVKARWCLCACLVHRAGAAAPLTADDVVRWSLEHHPEPVAARSDVDIARADRRAAALLLANPELEAAPTEVRLAQPLSITGEGWSARREAALGADAAAAADRRVDLVVAAEARDTWIDAAAADRRAALAEQALALAGRLRAATEAHAALGGASELDVRLSRLEEAHALADATAARADAARSRIALAAFHPDAVDAELADPLAGAPAAAGAGRDVRSDQAAAELRTDAAHAALNRARSAAVPAIAVGVAFDPGALGAAGSVRPYAAWSVPLFDRNQAGIARAEAELAVARAEAERVARVVAADRVAADRVADADDADLGRLGDIDADARAALAAIDSGVAAGELDLPTAVLLRADVLDGWTAAVEVRAEVAHARIARLLAYDDDALLGGAR